VKVCVFPGTIKKIAGCMKLDCKLSVNTFVCFMFRYFGWLAGNSFWGQSFVMMVMDKMKSS